MNEAQKKKYELLKETNLNKLKNNAWRENVLFCEFIEKLSYVEFISEEESNLLIKQLSEEIPISDAGHIEWSKSQYGSRHIDYSELHKYVNPSWDFYVIWDNAKLPVIKCKLEFIIENVDDIEAVSFSFFMVSEDRTVIIESEKFGHINLCIIR